MNLRQSTTKSMKSNHTCFRKTLYKKLITSKWNLLPLYLALPHWFFDILSHGGQRSRLLLSLLLSPASPCAERLVPGLASTWALVSRRWPRGCTPRRVMVAFEASDVWFSVCFPQEDGGEESLVRMLCKAAEPVINQNVRSMVREIWMDPSISAGLS